MSTIRSARTELPVPVRITPAVTGGLTLLALLVACAGAWFRLIEPMPAQALAFTLGFLALSATIAFVVTPRAFVPGFLTGLLPLMIAWRIAGSLEAWLVAWMILPAFLAYVAQFFEVLRLDASGPKSAAMTRSAWALTFLRLYAGFDLVPHFTEKLFAGSGPRMEDVQSFAGMGLPVPTVFVLLAGLCELAAAIGIGMGLLTRLAGVGTALYFVIASVIGGHFLAGFIWVSDGGGWEYPVLMMAIYLTFAAVGGGRFSIDGHLDRSGRFPAALGRAAFPRARESWT